MTQNKRLCDMGACYNIIMQGEQLALFETEPAPPPRAPQPAKREYMPRERWLVLVRMQAELRIHSSGERNASLHFMHAVEKPESQKG